MCPSQTIGTHAALLFYDIQLMPKDINLPGFIFELKAEKDYNDLKTLAQVALQQIVDNRYDKIMAMCILFR